MILQPIQKTRIYEQIVQQIQQMIREANYQPGDRLPSEREMAQAFSVSKSAVREAMSVLAAAGLLEIQPGKGIFLRHSRPVAYIQPFDMMNLETHDLPDLMEVRFGLEVEAASFAAQRATPDDLEALSQAYLAMESEIKSGGLAVDEDYAFHYAIAAATHNHVYLKVMNTISDLFRKGLKESKIQSSGLPGRPLVALEEHHKIQEAIRRRDSRHAATAMRKHLENIQRKIRLGLQTSEITAGEVDPKKEGAGF
ncbi:MAG: FadR family transcriptional regulator [Actinobacteria bacterium]|nr:FadR family transcriptional regulator [Actinomycetota bacterium]